MAAYTPAMHAAIVVDPDNSQFHNCCGYIDNRVLAANTAETFTVPTGAKFVEMNCTANYWVAYTFSGFDDRTAAVPAADTTDGSGVELNPTRRFLGGGGTSVTKISVITEANAKMSLAWFI